MTKFTDKEPTHRAVRRIAWVLKDMYDEQAENFKSRCDIEGNVRVNTRMFEHLIHDSWVEIGKSKGTMEPGRGAYREHVVPLAYIRDLSFKLYFDGKSVDDVAIVIERLLKVAYITPDEAGRIDKKYKKCMPKDWDYMSGSVTWRLDNAGIKIVTRE